MGLVYRSLSADFLCSYFEFTLEVAMGTEEVYLVQSRWLKLAQYVLLLARRKLSGKLTVQWRPLYDMLLRISSFAGGDIAQRCGAIVMVRPPNSPVGVGFLAPSHFRSLSFPPLHCTDTYYALSIRPSCVHAVPDDSNPHRSSRWSAPRADSSPPPRPAKFGTSSTPPSVASRRRSPSSPSRSSPSSCPSSTWARRAAWPRWGSSFGTASPRRSASSAWYVGLALRPLS